MTRSASSNRQGEDRGQEGTDWHRDSPGGVGKRIAPTLVKVLGKKTLSLGYAVAVSDRLLAPLMPSSTA
jgi:hypothetical protein